MSQHVLRLRPTVLAVTMLIAVAVALAAATGADAQSARTCRSADLRYPFMKGGPETFGVFRLKIAGGGCATAHRVAKGWMQRFEAGLRAGRVKLRRTVSGFAFRQLPPNAAQTYRLIGRRGPATIRFDYVVPNG
ncbi:hypothetical protein [Capillimicrobium parvum]|uniref:Uncharacterized protein n=1 Tax=Capillimicrobium parvum TaxID=2884022 RepID=A0A9E7C1H8_9ACTN|nr:hypothetical protein [Capillimicrobium parvum]UGS36704.1 hypothetical protein DSM104329_03113 [Capillimicrobium parvum]